MINRTFGAAKEKPQASAYTAGIKSFQLKVPFFNNPYKASPQHGLWINGYKRAEREFQEATRRERQESRTESLREVGYDYD